jgi:aryl sulfotransferase
MTARTVWLASYPKSGNTWVRALLTALQLGDGEFDINGLGHGPIASSRAHIEDWSGATTSDLTVAEIAWLRPRADAGLDATLEVARYRKIHDALRAGETREPIVDPATTRAAVYIVRDPRDVAVSFAHHAGRTLEWAVGRMADSAGMFSRTTKRLDPQVPQRLGTWSEHVRGWIGHDLFPVVTVRYEDLHADPEDQLARIAEAGGLEVDNADLAAAVAAAAFARLRAKEAASGFRERAHRDREFFRRGIAGGWRDELPAELAARIEADHGEVMARLGYLPGGA